MKKTKTSSDLSESTSSPCITVIAGLAYSIFVFALIRYHHHLNITTFWHLAWVVLMLGAFLTLLVYKSMGLVCDFIVMTWLIWWLYKGIGYDTGAFVFMPVVTGVWVSIGYRIQSRCAVPLVWAAPTIWFFIGNRLAAADFSVFHYGILVSSFMMLIVFTRIHCLRLPERLRDIDFILASYSGNTAHFAGRFIEGVHEAGARVKLLRFHYYQSFNPVLNGDGLVIAFPVYGGKPPWPLLNFLLFKCPRGRGKPAFILYTCVGGAENAGILCWFILSMKGYRVTGRNWAIYPLNVATFRLGPRRVWNFLDSLAPSKRALRSQAECGRAFAAGRRSGIPFVFGLTPFFLFGILADNRIVDRVLYRNHVFKKKCTSCGICVNTCPAKRLRLVDGMPIAKGECMICMSCVNLCPENAMHLWCFTEYGNRYPPKYIEGVVRRES